MYPQEIVAPMENELVSRGFDALRSSKEVDEVIAKEGTTLVVVNSVCGCAAGSARPGVLFSLENEKKPQHLTTVFAGVDREAVDQARNYMLPYPPHHHVSLFLKTVNWFIWLKDITLKVAPMT